MTPPVAVSPSGAAAPPGAAPTASVPVLETTSRYAHHGIVLL